MPTLVRLLFIYLRESLDHLDHLLHLLPSSSCTDSSKGLCFLCNFKTVEVDTFGKALWKSRHLCLCSFQHLCYSMSCTLLLLLVYNCLIVPMLQCLKVINSLHVACLLLESCRRWSLECCNALGWPASALQSSLSSSSYHVCILS